MPKHLYMLLLLTFVTGATVGVYTYFLTRGHTDLPDSSIMDDPSGYDIVMTTYGGCERMGCSSIRFEDSGKYTYLVENRGGDYSRYEDKISVSEQRTLKTLLAETPFDSLLTKPFQGTCPITYDGLAYRFAIQYDGATYDLDSCEVDLDGEPLFEKLISYFDSMSATYPVQ